MENNDGSDKGSGEGCEGAVVPLVRHGAGVAGGGSRATAAERHCIV